MGVASGHQRDDDIVVHNATLPGHEDTNHGIATTQYRPYAEIFHHTKRFPLGGIGNECQRGIGH